MREIRGPWATEEIDRYLDNTVIPLRISACTPSGWPLVLSVWFVREGAELVAATRPTSTLVRCLERDPRCGFEVAADAPPYRGVRGRADVTLDHESGAATLDRLLLRYLGGLDSPLATRLRADAEDEVCLRIRPRSVTSWDYGPRMAVSLRSTASE